MSNPSLQDGSSGNPNASTQSQIVLHIKKLLAEARVCLNALDQSTRVGLHSDEEYKDAVGHLLSPLTTIPISNLIHMTVKNAVETLTSQLGNLTSSSFDAGMEYDSKDIVDPSRISGVPKPDLSRQQCNPTSIRSQKGVAQSAQRKNPPELPSQSLHAGPRLGYADAQPSMAQQLDIETRERALLKIQDNRRMMATFYFIVGGKRADITLPHLVEEINKSPIFISEGGVSCAWETVRGDIVIAFGGRSAPFITEKRLDLMAADCSHLWTPGSSAFLHPGGFQSTLILDLEVLRGREPQIAWLPVIAEILRELKPSSGADLLYQHRTEVVSWSRCWVTLVLRGSDPQRLLEQEWPRSYKTTVEYGCNDVEIEVRMNMLYTEDKFDFCV